MAAIIIITVIIIAVSVFLYFQNNIIDITKYNIESKDINNKIIITQLSDLHSKPFKKVLKKLDEINPDIIVITGDYINDKCKNKDKMLSFGKELIKYCDVYYITGNHERRLENFDSLMSELENIGFKVLLNEVTKEKINGCDFSILGLDENMAGFDDYKARRKGEYKYKDMSKYFKNLSESSGFKLVMSHYPENFEKVKELNYKQYDFDLQLSGHAHGGQFILPFTGPVFSPGQGMFPKYARGSFGDRPRLIISRGLGNSEFPFRLFNHPEINVITLNEE